ncbi:MAG: STAS domain-containing protein [Anaerolineae bacterium]
MSNIQVSEKTKRVKVLAFRDRLDAFNASSTRAEIDLVLEEGVANYVVDLLDLDFMDSAGIAVLINLLKRARQLGGTVKLVRPTSPSSLRILHLTKFDRLFEMFDTADAAVNSF